MYDYVYIGSTPASEECAQVGAANYHRQSRVELALFKKCLEEHYKDRPEGVDFVIKEGEVCARFNSNDQKQCEYAYGCEMAPDTWEAYGVKAPRVDDEEFVKTELIPVPENGRRWLSEVGPCQLANTPLRARECPKTLGNEIVDGMVRGSGWALMCPACHSQNGVGLGTGKGQRYQKAVDGNFYKVEG